MKLKKAISFLLTAATAVSMLAGCGSSSSATSTVASAAASTASTAASTASAAASSAGSTAASSDGSYDMVMEIINLGTDDADLQEVQDAVNKITEPKTGVHVTFKTVAISEMATKLSLLAASGEKMDLVQAGLLNTPSALASQGLIVPMTNYLSDSLKEKAGKLLNACTINGEVYAYPGTLYCGKKRSLLYDTDLAKQYNITVPTALKTAEDWDNLFSQVKNSGMSQYAISLGDGVAAENSYNFFENLGDTTYVSYGVVMDADKSTTIENYYATDLYKEVCDMHRDWMEKGYALPDSISNGYTTMDTMQQGQVFSFATQTGTGASEAYFSAVTGKNLASIPIGDDVSIIDPSAILNTAWGISSTCENPQKVCDFLNLLYNDDELATLMNYGIEGKHYVTTEGSRIVNYPDGVTSANCGYGSFIGTYGDMTNQYFRAPLTDDFVSKISDYGVEKGKCSKFLGYTFDTSSISSQLSAVVAVIGQYGPALDCGTVDTASTLPEFISALESAGMNDIIAENQKQLDAWLATQK